MELFLFLNLHSRCCKKGGKPLSGDPLSPKCDIKCHSHIAVNGSSVGTSDVPSGTGNCSWSTSGHCESTRVCIKPRCVHASSEGSVVSDYGVAGVGVEDLERVWQVPVLVGWWLPPWSDVNIVVDVKSLQQVLLVSSWVLGLGYTLSVCWDYIDLDRHNRELLERWCELNKPGGVIDSNTETYPRVDSRVIKTINGVEIISTYAISQGKYASNTLSFKVLHTFSWCLVHDRRVRIVLLIPLHGPVDGLLPSSIGPIGPSDHRSGGLWLKGLIEATLWHQVKK